MSMDHSSTFRSIAEWELRNLSEALATLCFFGDFEKDIRGLEVLLCFRLLQLALGKVQLYVDALLQFFLLNKSFLEDLNQVLINKIFIFYCLCHLNKVNLLEMLVEDLFCFFV